MALVATASLFPYSTIMTLAFFLAIVGAFPYPTVLAFPSTWAYAKPDLVRENSVIRTPYHVAKSPFLADECFVETRGEKDWTIIDQHCGTKRFCDIMDNWESASFFFDDFPPFKDGAKCWEAHEKPTPEQLEQEKMMDKLEGWEGINRESTQETKVVEEEIMKPTLDDAIKSLDQKLPAVELDVSDKGQEADKFEEQKKTEQKDKSDKFEEQKKTEQKDKNDKINEQENKNKDSTVELELASEC